MPERRRPRAHIHRTFRGVMLGFCSFFALACHTDGGLPPSPHGDGPLTGRWIQRGTDTWVQFDLGQSGTRVVGYYRTGSANFGGSLSNPILVTGTAALPTVTLQWSDNGTQRTMNATLSPNGDTLTGTWGPTGQPAVSFNAFSRAAQ